MSNIVELPSELSLERNQKISITSNITTEFTLPGVEKRTAIHPKFNTSPYTQNFSKTRLTSAVELKRSNSCSLFKRTKNLLLPQKKMNFELKKNLKTNVHHQTKQPKINMSSERLESSFSDPEKHGKNFSFKKKKREIF